MLDMTKVRAASGCEDTIPVPKPSLWRKWAQTQKEHMGKVKADKKKKKKRLYHTEGLLESQQHEEVAADSTGGACQSNASAAAVMANTVSLVGSGIIKKTSL